MRGPATRGGRGCERYVGAPWLSESDLLFGFWGAIPILVFWSVWVAMSSPRGTKTRKLRLMAVIRALLLLECCGARSQLENAHIIIFQLARSGEIRVRDGFWGDPCAVLRGVGALFNGR